jgi:hypothetical protein
MNERLETLPEAEREAAEAELRKSNSLFWIISGRLSSSPAQFPEPTQLLKPSSFFLNSVVSLVVFLASAALNHLIK